MLGNGSRVTRNLSPAGSIDAHSDLEYGCRVLQAGLVRRSRPNLIVAEPAGSRFEIRNRLPALPIAVTQSAARQPFYTLFRHGVKPHLRGFQSLGWHADVQARPKENAGAHTYRRGDIGNRRIVVRVILLDRCDIAVGSEGIDSLAFRIVKAIVAVAPDGNFRNLLSIVGIKYDHHWRSPGEDEQPVVVFIERHGI